MTKPDRLWRKLPANLLPLLCDGAYSDLAAALGLFHRALEDAIKRGEVEKLGEFLVAAGRAIDPYRFEEPFVEDHVGPLVDEMVEAGFRSAEASLGPEDFALWEREKAVRRGPQLGDTLEIPPPPKSRPLYLTQAELQRVLALAEARCAELGRPELHSSMALLLAEVFGRFKRARAERLAGLTFGALDWEAAVGTGWNLPWRECVELTGVFVELQPAGTYGAKWFPPVWGLRPGSFEFESEAPKRPLWLRSVERERRWESLVAAATTGNGRDLRKRPS